MHRVIPFLLVVGLGLCAFGCHGGSGSHGSSELTHAPVPDAADASKAESQKTGDEFQAMKHELQQSQTFPRLKARAEAGGAMEQYQVGSCYENGDQVPQDYVQAAKWYQKSADQGFAAAQYSLGLLYEQGHGVPRDYKKAYFWLSLAASAEYGQDDHDRALRAEVVSARDSAAQHLKRPELVQVQEQTLEFEATHPKSY